MTRNFLIGLLVCIAGSATAQERPPMIAPTDPASVIEKLPSGYSELMPAAGAKTDPAAMPSIAQVQRLLGTAARTGDARLAARADALLSRFPRDTRNANILRARAFSAQHRHDFDLSRKILDTLVADEPRDADARLSRAQLALVQGRLEQARGDCVALTLGIDQGRGELCIASLSLRRGDFAASADVVDRWLAGASNDDPSRRYVLVTRAEIAWRSGDDEGADGWYREALALAPGDARTLLSYTRYLRDVGRDADVGPLVADAEGNDSLQLQRALAAHALRSADAPALADAQGRRYATAHEAGTQPELRDEAAYYLTLRNQPDKALALAQLNFESQRDYEDVEILQASANAANKPDALVPLREWAASQKLEIAPMDAAK